MKKYRQSQRLILLSVILSLCAFLIAWFFWNEAIHSVNLGYHYGFIGRGGVFKYHSIHLNSHTISLYWLMHLVGIVFMCVLNLYRRKQYKIGAMHAVITALLSAVSGFIGAKLLYILENIQQILVSGIQFGGVSFFGALFIIPAAVWMIQKLLRIHNPLFLDYCVPSALLMLGMIRIGCFLNGCCSGIHLTVNGNYCVVPVQLLECGFDFLILAYMLYSEIHHIYTGKHYPLLLLGYGTVRFLLEFLRSTPKVWIGFSNGQCFALLAIAVGMILWQSKKQV